MGNICINMNYKIILWEGVVHFSELRKLDKLKSLIQQLTELFKSTSGQNHYSFPSFKSDGRAPNSQCHLSFLCFDFYSSAFGASPLLSTYNSVCRHRTPLWATNLSTPSRHYASMVAVLTHINILLTLLLLAYMLMFPCSFHFSY